MMRKAVASSVALVLGIAFMLPIWAAAAYENDDSVLILFGMGFFFPIALVGILFALTWATTAYFMRPSHRGTPWTFVSALGMGGVLAGLGHAFLALGALDVYEDSYAGFWFAVATALAVAIALAVAAPAGPPHAAGATAPSLKPRPPSPRP